MKTDNGQIRTARTRRRPWRALAAAVLAAALPPAAVQAVDTVTAARSGDDLVIRWEPVSPAADGYRVYRSDDPTCPNYDLAAETTRTEHTEPGVLGAAGFAVYRVVAFTGAIEAPASPPIYKYGVLAPVVAGGISGAMASLPYEPPLADAIDMCTDANGQPQVTTPFTAMSRWSAQNAGFAQFSCSRVFGPFPLAPGEPYHYLPDPAQGTATAVIWGVGSHDWRYDLSDALVPRPSPQTPLNLYEVSLPFDHDYTTLQDIGDDVPNAVMVARFDPAGNAVVTPFVVGLTRDDARSAWTGDNFRIDTARGHAVFVGVDRPTSWRPRQNCAGAVTTDRTGRLRAVKNGDDADLYWQARPVRSFDVYKLADKRLLADLASQPVELVVAPPPAFPVTVTSGPAGVRLFYNAVGRP